MHIWWSNESITEYNSCKTVFIWKVCTIQVNLLKLKKKKKSLQNYRLTYMAGLKSKSLTQLSKVVKVWIISLPYKLTPSFVEIFSDLKSTYTLQLTVEMIKMKPVIRGYEKDITNIFQILFQKAVCTSILHTHWARMDWLKYF